LRQERDIVLIDQRGTGKSNPLPCPFNHDDAQVLIDGAYSPESLPACRVELEKRADLTEYTTSNAADDADEVREALGYGPVDVLGGSYGTLAGLVYLRRHAAHVRAVVLMGVAPPDYKMPLEFARTIQGSLDRLFADCAADAACHRDFPNLKAEFETLVRRLAEKPAAIQVAGAGGGPPHTITLSRGSFVSGLRPLLYQPGIVSQLPYILHRAYENDWNTFAAVTIAMNRALAEQIARGMALSVNCAEGVPFIREADIRRETAGTYLGDFDVRRAQDLCKAWPHAKVARDFLAPVRGDVPVLLITGAADPATPPWAAEHAARRLPHGRVVAIPNGTHGTSSACIDKMIAQFVNQASAEGVDTACVSQIRNPPFLTIEQVGKLRTQAGQ